MTNETMGDGGGMSTKQLAMRQALLCLYAQMPVEVARDVTGCVMDAVEEVEVERDALRERVRELATVLGDVLRDLVTVSGFPDKGKGRTEQQQAVFDAARAALEKAREA